MPTHAWGIGFRRASTTVPMRAAFGDESSSSTAEAVGAAGAVMLVASDLSSSAAGGGEGRSSSAPRAPAAAPSARAPPGRPASSARRGRERKSAAAVAAATRRRIAIAARFPMALSRDSTFVETRIMSARGRSVYNTRSAVSEDAPAISVIVCTRDRARLLEPCLASLAAQTLAPGRFEVLVVDNGSTDATPALARRFAAEHAHFRVLAEPRAGRSLAANAALHAARGRYVAFIDDDARARPAWVERILAAFETREPRPVAVGGEIHPIYETPPPAWLPRDDCAITWGPRPGFLRGDGAELGFAGSNMALDREVALEVGGFAAHFGPAGGRFRFGEDTEIFARIEERRPGRFF